MLDRSKSPKINSFSNLHFDYPDFITLKNGVKLYIVNKGDQDVNRLEVICRGGMFEETKPLQSFALSSMLIHGSEEYSSSEVAEKLDFTGSYMSAVNHDNFTHVTLNSLNKNLKDILPVFKSILTMPAIPEREFEVLKAQVKSAYQTARRKVKYLSQMEGRRLYFGDNHPLAHMVSDDDVSAITIADVKDYHKKYYRPENYTLILSGKISDNVLTLITNAFCDESKKDTITELKTFERNPSKEMVSVVNSDDALQSAVYMIHEAIPRSHCDYINMRILAMVLGGYFGSRLMQNIREDKGYTYGINAMLMGRQCGSKLAIISECDTAYTYLLIDEVKNEVKKLQEQLISREELEMVRNCMLSDLSKTLDSPFSMAGCVSSNILYGTGEDYFNRQVEQITKITPKVLRDVANKYLDLSKFRIAIAGDEKQLKLYCK